MVVGVRTSHTIEPIGDNTNSINEFIRACKHCIPVIPACALGWGTFGIYEHRIIIGAVRFQKYYVSCQ